MALEAGGIAAAAGDNLLPVSAAASKSLLRHIPCILEQNLLHWAVESLPVLVANTL